MKKRFKGDDEISPRKRILPFSLCAFAQTETIFPLGCTDVLEGLIKELLHYRVVISMG